MTTADMVDLLKQRTKITDSTKLLRELRAAYQWAVLEVFKSADGPQLLMTVGEELTLATDTRDYDLEANLVGGNILGLQQLWAKVASGTDFVRLKSCDITSDQFTSMDSSTAANPLVASDSPVYYGVVNFGQVRFAPSLPAGTIIRADYAMFGAAPDPATNPTQTDGIDFPIVFHFCIVDKATAHLFNTLDDTREGSWETRAMTSLNTAIYAASKSTRTQRPVETRPFRSGLRRWV